ncbi:hypothetical protein EIN_430100 [Entamoeba invadens IP1]|uniref:Uncharacterized protein n=2 Tax=Entamoeba invadens TaxID=33085 RepID=A0A0A1UGW2_ENTIV|nr:hypothetical protein EIN_430100 [Entamoeba invadens IP1]ELP95214.1 hypothetical protein EIN_430100 [Entamoeba invadens IP1]BAN42474.1 hypothetical protein [Entamoeba invadens]|eukprot:XP_004261985.1 hypothetical protein EIN_430100 [Entamoeba invadens IP1]
MIFLWVVFTLLLSVESVQVTKKEVYDFSYLCGILNTLGFTLNVQRQSRLSKTFQPFVLVSYSHNGMNYLINYKIDGTNCKRLIDLIQRNSPLQITTKQTSTKSGFSSLNSIHLLGKVVDSNFAENLSVFGELFNQRIKGLLNEKNTATLNGCSPAFKELRAFVPNQCSRVYTGGSIPSTSPSSCISETNSVLLNQEPPTYSLLVPDYRNNVYVDLAYL